MLRVRLGKHADMPEKTRLHYVFPRECPFPHKSGATSAASPWDYGTGYAASGDEMRRHASQANATEVPATMGREELQWMSLWSPEEELITDHPAMRAPWERSGVVAAAALVVFLVMFGLIGMGRTRRTAGGILPSHSGGKSHFV